MSYNSNSSYDAASHNRYIKALRAYEAKIDQKVRQRTQGFDVELSPIIATAKGSAPPLGSAGVLGLSLMKFGGRYKVLRSFGGNQCGRATEGEILRFLGEYSFPWDNGQRLYFEDLQGSKRNMEFSGIHPAQGEELNQLYRDDVPTYFAPDDPEWDEKGQSLSALAEWALDLARREGPKRPSSADPVFKTGYRLKKTILWLLSGVFLIGPFALWTMLLAYGCAFKHYNMKCAIHFTDYLDTEFLSLAAIPLLLGAFCLFAATRRA